MLPLQSKECFGSHFDSPGSSPQPHVSYRIWSLSVSWRSFLWGALGENRKGLTAQHSQLLNLFQTNASSTHNIILPKREDK